MSIALAAAIQAAQQKIVEQAAQIAALELRLSALEQTAQRKPGPKPKTTDTARDD